MCMNPLNGKVVKFSSTWSSLRDSHALDTKMLQHLWLSKVPMALGPVQAVSVLSMHFLHMSYNFKHKSMMFTDFMEFHNTLHLFMGLFNFTKHIDICSQISTVVFNTSAIFTDPPPLTAHCHQLSVGPRAHMIWTHRAHGTPNMFICLYILSSFIYHIYTYPPSDAE